MPQITAEKKFFRIRVDENTQNLSLLTLQFPTVAELQQIQKNITGGAE